MHQLTFRTKRFFRASSDNEWRKVICNKSGLNFPHHEVSRTGQVRNKFGKLLATSKGSVRLSFENNSQTLQIPRLVCTIFNGPPPNSSHKFVKIKNRKKNDIRPENLCWATDWTEIPLSIMERTRKKFKYIRTPKIADEIWKLSSIFPCWEVSNHGRVRSKRFGRLVSLALDGNGYPIVYYNSLYLYSFRKRQPFRRKSRVYSMGVHRLVAQEFCERPPDCDQVDHVNGCRTDNRAENLKWTTAKENINNPYRLERISKAVVQKTKDGVSVAEFGSIVEAEKVTGVSRGGIGRCCKGKQKSSGGFCWQWTMGPNT